MIGEWIFYALVLVSSQPSGLDGDPPEIIIFSGVLKFFLGVSMEVQFRYIYTYMACKDRGVTKDAVVS